MRDYTTDELRWEYENEYVKRAWKIWPKAFRDFDHFVESYHAAPLTAVNPRTQPLSNFSGPYEDPVEVIACMSHRRDVHAILRGFDDDLLPPPLLINRRYGDWWVMSGNTRLSVASALRYEIKCKIMETGECG